MHIASELSDLPLLIHQWHSLEIMPCRSKEQDEELAGIRQQLKAQGYDWEGPPKARANSPSARVNATGYFARKCADCEHWKGQPTGLEPTGDTVQAECRRRAPVNHPIVDQGAILWRNRWPITQADDWCGEFKDIADMFKPPGDAMVFTPGTVFPGSTIPGEIRELVNIAASIELHDLPKSYRTVDTVNALEELILKAQDIVETTL